jgi:Plectin/S10 domain
LPCLLAPIVIQLDPCCICCCCRFLTDEGIEHLREYLNISADAVPATLKKSTRPLERAPGGGERPPRRDFGDRPPRRDFGGDGGGECQSCVGSAA